MTETPESFDLYCDAPGCDAQISMPFGVARDEHGWGRITVYTKTAGTDYDLCTRHHNAVLDGLWSDCPEGRERVWSPDDPTPSTTS